MMEISNLIPHIEALIFASEKPLTTLEITDLINNAFGFMEDKIMLDQIESSIEGIIEKYKAEFYPFEVRESGGGWQFLTKKDFHKTVAQLNGEKFLKRLSTAALETLSIVAYKQPVTKSEIEAIRGVSSDYAIQKLLEKDLIVITGRNETLPGHPLVYGTSKNFMDYFGLNTTDDLPKLKEVFDDNIVIPTAVSEEGAAQQAAENEGAGEAVDEEATPSANGSYLNGTEITLSEEGTEEEATEGEEELEQDTDEESIAEEAEALDEEAGEVLDEIAEEGYDEEETSGEEETYITPEEDEEETYDDDDSTSFKVDEDGELVEEQNDEEEEALEGEDEERAEDEEEEEFDEEEEEDEEAGEEEEVEGEEEIEDEEGSEDEEAGDDDDNEADDEDDKKDEEKK
jgi:segregation and condensation protein B